jgi:hypothetical protein
MKPGMRAAACQAESGTRPANQTGRPRHKPGRGSRDRAGCPARSRPAGLRRRPWRPVPRKSKTTKVRRPGQSTKAATDGSGAEVKKFEPVFVVMARHARPAPRSLVHHAAAAVRCAAGLRPGPSSPAPSVGQGRGAARLLASQERKRLESLASQQSQRLLPQAYYRATPDRSASNSRCLAFETACRRRSDGNARTT